MRKKPAILDQLLEGLEKVGIAKYERKRAFDAGVQVQETERIKILERTKRIAIREESDIKKRHTETEKELEDR